MKPDNIKEGQYAVIEKNPQSFFSGAGKSGLSRVEYPYFLKAVRVYDRPMDDWTGVTCQNGYGWAFEWHSPIRLITEDEYYEGAAYKKGLISAGDYISTKSKTGPSFGVVRKCTEIERNRFYYKVGYSIHPDYVIKPTKQQILDSEYADEYRKTLLTAQEGTNTIKNEVPRKITEQRPTKRTGTTAVRRKVKAASAGRLIGGQVTNRRRRTKARKVKVSGMRLQLDKCGGADSCC